MKNDGGPAREKTLHQWYVGQALARLPAVLANPTEAVELAHRAAGRDVSSRRALAHSVIALADEVMRQLNDREAASQQESEDES